ncbi:MAG: RNA polymerase sigma factor SigA [Parcubacteria group bacterium ADurb.Bin316]|nr:MAG: RNA polymerase sigma factor SigA [Parcubacteria group bacterium ADurb.Bin316]HOZ56424.1 sigma factor-like helix-turn-helix DNA-binding protein [bacterium]
MENVSILDQIINYQKAEEVANLDAVEIIGNLFNELSDRERDVLMRRYGLSNEGKETLEGIGKVHNLTRERIRQIETAGVKRLQQLKNLDDYVKNLKRIILQLLEEHGGLMEKNYLLDILASFSSNGFKADPQVESKHKNYLNFLITKLLHNEFEEVISSKHFLSSYKLKYQELYHLEELTEELLQKISEAKKILATEELIDIICSLESYKKHEDKLTTKNTLDISNVLKFDLYDENSEIINKNKTLYSILRAAKKIEQNKFGHWGIHNWREIKPKTINDKIYLVLKNSGEPMHFEQIAEQINKIGFDGKKANAATVHNELILDDKYILVGRGLYGLKEWGYKKGTVVDVIEEILKEADQSLSRDEIIAKVLEKRYVKKATIILALMNKDRFLKADGKYSLIKA